jgi:prophage antirepressor-like protein
MNEVQLFNFENHEVRSLLLNNEPWFVGKDVADVLGYSNSRKAMADHVDDEDKEVLTSRNVTLENIPNRGITVVNESGLYSLILSSKLPSAKKFKRWVTSEVLPALRKTGQYQVKELSGSELMAKALIEAQNVLAAKDKQIEEMKPKASYYDVILNCKGLLATSVIAKDYGWSAIRLNEYLHKKGIQFKQGKTWLLYQKYATEGYASTKTHEHLGNDGTNHANVHTYWTQKGRRFIYDLLKNDGIVPLIEREENG